MTKPDRPSQISELLIDKISADEPNWIEEGACVKANVDPFDPKNAKTMLSLCSTCPVSKECGEYRDEHNISNGVWAGIDLNDGR